jgi:ketosteroid isomerase-like protein
MATTTLGRAGLEDLTRRFTQAFNDEDLDRVMGFFAEDAVYDTFDDEPAKGLAEIRAAFEPQFAGAYGEMRFLEEDLFVDAAPRRALIRWTCTLETPQGRAAWRGLDILHFDPRGRITYKGTYAKARAPLLRPRP